MPIRATLEGRSSSGLESLLRATPVASIPARHSLHLWTALPTSEDRRTANKYDPTAHRDIRPRLSKLSHPRRGRARHGACTDLPRALVCVRLLVWCLTVQSTLAQSQLKMTHGRRGGAAEGQPKV
eukprot:351934-Chlamydomonas_euryale.AAC.9